VRIAITGATGFIGRRICSLLESPRYRVRALARNAPAARRLLASDVEIVTGDLASPEVLRAAVRDADAVLHLAGAVRGATRADFDAANVDGSAELLAAMDAVAPRARLLFFSSLAAREPALSHYAASKRRAEELLLTRAGARPVTILRPPAVYGPGDREMLPVFRFMARTGRAPCAGKAADRLSLIFVDDLARAARAWLDAAAVPTATWCLHDGRDGGYDWPALCTIVGEACGREILAWEIPRAPLDLVARGNRALGRLLRRSPMLTPEKLRELRHPDWVCDNAAISAALDWTPRTQLAEGLRLTPGWRDRVRP
jgi:nucleoside-diphosphate-sugar epimerase